jgi:C4-dicarboxylate transporter/malic acid transport protein
MQVGTAGQAGQAAPRNRHPGWFGAVMGTGALTLALDAQAKVWEWDWLMSVAVTFLLITTGIAVLLIPRYARRLRAGGGLHSELANPAQGAMLATLPAGLILLSDAWGNIGPELVPSGLALWIDGVLLVVGALLVIALGLAWATSMLRTSPGLDGVNGGWLIPPAMNMLVPLGMVPLIAANPSAAPLLVLVGFAFLGIGFILFMAILTLLIARLALREPLPAALAPSMWIPLAPAGIIGLSTLRLLQAAQGAEVPGFDGVTAGLVVSAMGIGFGLWWAGFALLDLVRMRRSGIHPAHPGWWGFVFPIGAMTLSITAVGSATGIRGIDAVGLAATGVLAAVWVGVVWSTARPQHSLPVAEPVLQ